MFGFAIQEAVVCGVQGDSFANNICAREWTIMLSTDRKQGPFLEFHDISMWIRPKYSITLLRK